MPNLPPRNVFYLSQERSLQAHETPCSRILLYIVVTFMSTRAENLVSQIRSLPEEEQLKVLDALLTELDTRDSDIDHVWATEARKRWNAYKAGKVATVSYQELMAKYSR